MFTSEAILDARKGNEQRTLDEILTPRLIDGTVVYGRSATSRSELVAFDVEAGNTVWKTTVSGILDDASLIGTTEHVFTRVYTNSKEETITKLTAFDRQTGERRWSGVERDSSLGPVASDGDFVYYSDVAGVYARSVDDGSIRWTHEDGTFGLPPSVAAGTVYAVESDGSAKSVFAIDRTDGTVRWERRIDADDRICGPLTVTDERLYVPTFWQLVDPTRNVSDVRLLALDTASGETEWQQKVPVSTAVTLAGDHLYAGGRTDVRTGVVAAYDAKTGDEQWRFTRSENYSGEKALPPPILVSWPIVVDGYVFINIEDELYAIG